MSTARTQPARPMPRGPMRGRGMPVPKGAIKKGTFTRLIKTIFKYYKTRAIIALTFLMISAAGGLVSAVYMKGIVGDVLEPALALDPITGMQVGLTPDLKARLMELVILMISVYATVILSSFAYTRIMATITQGTLYHLRSDMFAKMQNLPIKYFDTHAHGEIMSGYTNDTDATRQLIGQSLPTLLSSSITLIASVVLMFAYSIWLFFVVLVCTIAMSFVVKIVGGKSAKYMVAQQGSIARAEGFVEEMMKGQKVVKVFTHEEKAKEEFDVLNEQLFTDSARAHSFGNVLGPILGNIGNITYVLIVIVGGILCSVGAKNLCFEGLFKEGTMLTVFDISVIVAFLGISRQFTQTVNQMSHQISMVAMGLAGASRVFTVMDEQPETDEGYVTLVNAKKDENGNLIETEERTGLWAWKHYHKAENSTTYTELKGDIVMDMVDFGYVPEKQVLTDVSLYAKPGQKIAFVGATGAGKTTITNLINRFYDIADGKIRYDGINVNKIKKDDLRRSLGVVLQETNLFTGTVMENIRYGRLDATDEECIAAAKLANADDFITRLPNGYDTMLTNNGASLSQGQRQLLAIARAAVADPPVMILDEATSSIDTRTEALVQDGMDKLMHGRTVFVIAHRLSTVQNSDAIMVLDHGRIIERGTHEQLIEMKGTYYQLYTGAFELE